DDAQPSATGHAFEQRGVGSRANRTSHIENCETSAIGRALAMLGFEVERGIASREEMEKVRRMEASSPLKVIRGAGGYYVDERFVEKPNGKIICSCKADGCAHIAAVREFARTQEPEEER